MDGKRLNEAINVGLPIRPFLYTLDQIATLIMYKSAKELHEKHLLYYDGRSTGLKRMDEMVAHDIAVPGEKPEWRVAEQELVRWLRRKGFRVQEPRWLSG